MGEGVKPEPYRWGALLAANIDSPSSEFMCPTDVPCHLRDTQAVPSIRPTSPAVPTAPSFTRDACLQRFHPSIEDQPPTVLSPFVTTVRWTFRTLPNR